MKIDVISIFPEYLSPLKLSLLGKAQNAGLVDIAVHDLRAQTNDNHNTVDDTPYGGGAGMVMLPEVDIRKKRMTVIPPEISGSM